MLIDGLPGLIAIGFIAIVGFLMVRAFNTRRSQPSASSDGSTSYWSGSSSDCNSTRDSDRSESGWFSGLFSSSDSSSSSHDSGSSSGGGDSGGGGDGGGGGGGD
jgi:hypothetical protein